MSDRKNEITLGCKSCGARWGIPDPVGVSELEWAAAINAQSCPECRAPYRLTSRPPASVPPPVAAASVDPEPDIAIVSGGGLAP